MKNILILILNLVVVLIEINASYSPKKVLQLQVNNPGFTKFIPNGNAHANSYHLAISSFSGMPFSHDNIYFFQNISLASTASFKTLNNSQLYWPNTITISNKSIINQNIDQYGGIIVSSGFLVPTKSKGGLFYYPFSTADRSDVREGAPINLAYQNKENLSWFYHRTQFVDLNADGVDDILTCRTYKPIFGSTRTELVSFVFDKTSSIFNEIVIMKEACDVFFDTADIDKDGRFEIISAGFFISKLNVIYSDDLNNNFLNGNTKVKTIDSESGQFFDIKIADLDGQDNLELLVTNHQGNNLPVKGGMFYYSLHGNIRDGLWTKFIIYDTFPVLKSGFNQAAPGSAVLFYPNLNKKDLPHIVLAGDGSEYTYYFEPNLVDNFLNYTLVWTEMFADTVGGIDIADIDNDGYSEMIIPVYEKNLCFIYTFAT